VSVRSADGTSTTLRSKFLHLCTGYYSYTEAYRPSFEGEADFRGQIIHPQFWPENLDYSGKRIVVIGSGATAVTLVPALAEKAAHVTQLQRTPSYVVNQPGEDPWARALGKILPATLVYPLVRWKHILVSSFFYKIARKYPRQFGARLVELAAAELPKDFDVRKHFKPAYNPWDQRVCAAPDGDIFRAIRKGHVSVVTDTIEKFVPEGIRLASGAVLPADIVVTATGLKVQPLGDIQISLDGKAADFSDTMVYRGAMLSGIPNLVLTFGYTNASWTLRADLIAAYVCRLLKHLDRHGLDYAVPVRDSSVGEMPFIDFNSGYVLRALDRLPKQGDRFPWRVHQTYLRDLGVTRFSKLTDPALKFGRARKRDAA
ncbi:MAG: flavin-containing monooxygenase, partial [Gammaproteobacteria bacterium]